MNDDLQNSEVIDQFHHDLLVERLRQRQHRFSNDLEKGASVDEVLKTAFRRVFLQAR
jgi:hypothetical protein